MTELEFDKKYQDINIDNLTDEELSQFKNDCFEMYEQGGFLDRFDSPYDELEKRIGERFEVIRRATTEEFDLEALPIWLIKFEDGDTAYCYAEEITKIENKRVRNKIKMEK